MILMFIFLFIFVFLFVNKDNEKNKNVKQKEVFEEKGVFISYIDYAELLGKNKQEIEDIISEMISNISYFGLNSVILQVRPFSDAIYPSSIYQSSHVVVKKEGDPLPIDILKYFIEEAKQKDISVYAWVNPYRIRNDNNIGDINKNSFYYKWLNTDYIEITNKGIFLNPAKDEVINYITDGLAELCKNYDIKGVIYDDYYYPSDTIDLKDYEKTDKKKTLKEYRINNINKLIEKSYDTVKKVNKNLKFGISPAGNIENNLDKEYLDIKYILISNKLDMIIPQLYYGFENSGKPFLSTIHQWQDINIKNKKFYVALSLYKSGNIDEWAGKGKNEWLLNTDIIKKQILISRNIKNYNGFYIYRYENIFNPKDNENCKKEIENLRKLINNK